MGSHPPSDHVTAVWDMLVALTDALREFEYGKGEGVSESLWTQAVALLRTTLEELEEVAEHQDRLRFIEAKCVLYDVTDDMEAELPWRHRLVDAYRTLSDPPVPGLGIDWDDVAGQLQILAALQVDTGRATEAKHTIQELARLSDEHALNIDIEAFGAEMFD